MYSPIEAKLICYATEQDENGYDKVVVKKETEVFVTLKSVGYTEYYKAYEVGIKPRVVAMMYAQEYEESFYERKAPSHCIIDGILYQIVREYQTDIDHTELTLAIETRNEEGVITDGND